MRGIALLKVVSAAALLLQASAQSLKELLSAPFAGTESSADGVSTPPDAAAAPTGEALTGEAPTAEAPTAEAATVGAVAAGGGTAGARDAGRWLGGRRRT